MMIHGHLGFLFFFPEGNCLSCKKTAIHRCKQHIDLWGLMLRISIKGSFKNNNNKTTGELMRHSRLSSLAHKMPRIKMTFHTNKRHSN